MSKGWEDGVSVELGELKESSSSSSGSSLASCNCLKIGANEKTAVSICTSLICFAVFKLRSNLAVTASVANCKVRTGGLLASKSTFLLIFGKATTSPSARGHATDWCLTMLRFCMRWALPSLGLHLNNRGISALHRKSIPHAWRLLGTPQSRPTRVKSSMT